MDPIFSKITKEFLIKQTNIFAVQPVPAQSLWTTHGIRNDRLRPHQGFRTLETPPGHVEALKYQNTWVCAHALSNHPQTTSRAQNIH